MQLTNNQIINLYEILNSLNSQEKLPIKLGFTIIHNIKILQTYYESVMETRERLIRENGTQDEDGRIQVPPELINEVNNQLYSLLDMEISVKGIILINLNELELGFKELNLDSINKLYPILRAEL